MSLEATVKELQWTNPHAWLQVTAPDRPGDYELEVDLVHEGITWFADRGGKTATVALRVT